MRRRCLRGKHEDARGDAGTMRRTGPAALAISAALLLPLTAGAPLPARASTEALDGPIGLAGATLNAAEHDLAVIVMKDRQFLPPVVTLRSGGTVLFVWADSEKREHHSPQSSGSTGDPATDLGGGYVPAAPGACFSSILDLGAEIVGEGSTYPLTLAFAGGRISKSMGYFGGSPVGDLTGAQALRLCPAGSHSVQAGAAVVPFHCKLHGFQFGGDQGRMKGAVLVLP